MKKTTSGFTIVELLIVIVVIAILAAISIVSYTSITSRANNAAVQTDVRNLTQKIIEYNAREGQYPTTGQLTTAAQGFSAARASYASNNNLIYCVNAANTQFGILARSKSGEVYLYSSETGAGTRSDLPSGGAAACPLVGVSSPG